MSLRVRNFFCFALMSSAFAYDKALAQTEIGREPYQEYVYQYVGAAGILMQTFRKVPLNRRLDITNVSCYIRSGFSNFNPYQIDYLQLVVIDGKGGILSALTLAPTPLIPSHPDNAQKITFAANHTISMFAPAGYRFQILLKPIAFNPEGLACHISGQMVKLGT